jgi:hypothetical protein
MSGPYTRVPGARAVHRGPNGAKAVRLTVALAERCSGHAELIAAAQKLRGDRCDSHRGLQWSRWCQRKVGDGETWWRHFTLDGNMKGRWRGRRNGTKVTRGQNARGGTPYIGPGAASRGGGED